MSATHAAVPAVSSCTPSPGCWSCLACCCLCGDGTRGFFFTTLGGGTTPTEADGRATADGDGEAAAAAAAAGDADIAAAAAVVPLAFAVESIGNWDFFFVFCNYVRFCQLGNADCDAIFALRIAWFLRRRYFSQFF